MRKLIIITILICGLVVVPQVGANEPDNPCVYALVDELPLKYLLTDNDKVDAFLALCRAQVDGKAKKNKNVLKASTGMLEELDSMAATLAAGGFKEFCLADVRFYVTAAEKEIKRFLCAKCPTHPPETRCSKANFKHAWERLPPLATVKVEGGLAVIFETHLEARAKQEASAIKEKCLNCGLERTLVKGEEHWEYELLEVD